MTAALKQTPIRGPIADTEEWHKLRLFDPSRESHKILWTASEAAAVCNQSPYCSALQLCLTKTGRFPREDEDPEVAERMEVGREMEPVTLRIYGRRTRQVVDRNQHLYFHHDRDDIGATPDGFATNIQVDDGASRAVVECKNAGFRMFDRSGEDVNKYGESGTDNVPVYVLAQAQWQMGVMGLYRCDVPVLANGNALKIYVINREEMLIDAMFSAAAELTERLLNNELPEPNWSHDRTRECLRVMFGHTVGKVVTLGPEKLTLWKNIRNLRASMRSLESAEEEAANKFMFDVGDAEIVRFEGSDIQVKRIAVRESFVTQKDVDELAAKVGLVKRKGHYQLREQKAKKK